MEKTLFSGENCWLIYNEETKDLVWIQDDTATFIEPTDDLMERYRTIKYFETLPMYAFTYIINKLKDQL